MTDRLAEEIAITEELYRLAVEASPSGILIVNASGTIVYANDALCAMFGYAANELAGAAVESLVPSELAEAHRHYRQAFAENPNSRSMGGSSRFQALRKDGTTFPAEIGLRPTVGLQQPLVVATVIDVSERRRIEAQLELHEEHLEELVEQRTRELRETQAEKDRVVEHLVQSEKLAAIGTLVSGIGHEINNPLYFILGLAEQIRDGSDLARCKEYGAEIIAHSKRIAATVKGLSGYARPAGRELQPVDPNAMVSAAVQTARRVLRSDEIDIELDLNQTPCVLAKADEMQQVFFNIIRNGIQAIDGKGSVHIKSSTEADWVLVELWNSGAPIPAGLEKRIFDPFFTTKGPDEGEGLGLYIVRQIVIKHSGRIDVTSNASDGTTFTVRLPSCGTAQYDEGGIRS